MGSFSLLYIDPENPLFDGFEFKQPCQIHGFGSCWTIFRITEDGRLYCGSTQYAEPGCIQVEKGEGEYGYFKDWKDMTGKYLDFTGAIQFGDLDELLAVFESGKLVEVKEVEMGLGIPNTPEAISDYVEATLPSFNRSMKFPP